MSIDPQFRQHRYVFARHGRSQPWWLRQRQLRRQLQPEPASGTTVMSLEQITASENLLRVHRRLKATGGPAAGIDGITYDDICTTEVADALRHASRAIQQRRYRPHPVRVQRVPKARGGYRELRIATVIDRTIAAALTDAVTPLLDPQWLDSSYGFRLGRSTLMMLADMEQTMIRQGRWVLLPLDIRQAFDNVLIDGLLPILPEYIADEQLLNLIDVIVRGDEGRSHTLGLDQGSPLSPILLNLWLHHGLDLPYSADPANPPQYRYADDLTYLCCSVPDGRQAIRRVKELLAPTGLQLRDMDVQPTNLRRQGARAQVLGFLVSQQDGRLVLGIGPDAWAGLRQGLTEAYEAQHPTETAQAVISGWLAAYGMAVESEDVTGVVDGILQTAAQLGHRELTSRPELETAILEAQVRWLRIRERALETATC